MSFGVATLPVPYLGKNSRDPTAVIKAPECADILNFNPEQGGVVLRQGDTPLITIGGLIGALSHGLVPYGDSELFRVYFDGGNTNFTPLGAAPARVIFGGGNDQIAWLYFNKNLYIMGSFSLTPTGVGVQVYNGTAWGISGYTYASITPFGGCSFKNRAYFLGLNSTKFAYSGIDAISGACTEVDLGSIITNSSTLAAIQDFTISDTTKTANLLAFIFFSGEILFYSGTYPDDPTTWNLEGRGKIGAPLSYNSTIAYRNDSLVLTDVGIFSLKDTFLAGSSGGETITISAKIDPSWKSLVQNIRDSQTTPAGNLRYVQGIWDKANNRIVISFPRGPDSAGGYYDGSYYFILDTKQLGWFGHRSYGLEDNYVVGIGLYNNKLYGLTSFSSTTGDSTLFQKEGGSDYVDFLPSGGTIGFPFLIESAPIPFQKTGAYSALGIEPIMQSDQYEVTNYYLIGDIGRVTTPGQTVQDQGQSVAKPEINIGIHGSTFSQFKVAGNTQVAAHQIGLKYYNFNVWYDLGEKGSR